MHWLLKYFGFWLLIGVLLFCVCKLSYAADFQFGTDTYEKWDDILIVNSLGDKVEESQFKTDKVDLGYNDYIPENAFKNDLYRDGYTKVYDDMPTDGTEVVDVGYMGRLGDPRTYDTDYVLKSEYDKYSAQSQDTRIEENKTEIRDLGESVVINTSNIATNTSNISKNEANIANNVKWLQSNTSRIDANEAAIASNANRIDNLDGRVGELEETKVGVHGEVDLYDTRFFKMGAYTTYDARHSRWDAIMGKITFKPFKSYELKRLEKLERELAIEEAVETARERLYNGTKG